jgi:hypothetical protein
MLRLLRTLEDDRKLRVFRRFFFKRFSQCIRER